MDNHIVEYIRDLPPLLQFILALITILGTSGFFTGIFGYLAARDSAISARRANKELAEQKVRLESLEIKSIKAKAEAEQITADKHNTQKLIEVIAASNDRFQKVIDVKSERQLESDKMQHETNKMFLDAVNRQTSAVVNLSELIEIQSEHYTGFVDKLDNTLKTVETFARDNRADMTTALGLSVTHRAENENTLRSIQQTIHSIATDVRDIITKNENQQTQTLVAINAKLQSLESSVSTLIAPRPTLLNDTMPLPDLPQAVDTQPETWNEDTETTAIIPPRKLADDDDNPLLNTA
jgi:hypothetical protein